MNISLSRKSVSTVINMVLIPSSRYSVASGRTFLSFEKLLEVSLYIRVVELR